MDVEGHLPTFIWDLVAVLLSDLLFSIMREMKLLYRAIVCIRQALSWCLLLCILVVVLCTESYCMKADVL